MVASPRQDSVKGISSMTRPITARLGDVPENDAAEPCQDAKHFAPERKRKPGLYLHTCPSCGHEQQFRVEEEPTDG